MKLGLGCLVWFLISCLKCLGKNNGQKMLKASNLHSKINKINSTRKGQKPKLMNQWKEMDFVQHQQLCGSTSFPIMFWIFVSFAPANELQLQVFLKTFQSLFLSFFKHSIPLFFFLLQHLRVCCFLLWHGDLPISKFNFLAQALSHNLICNCLEFYK